MIRWLPDRTGRFSTRPHFDLNEIDRRCERVVEQFSHRLYGQEAVSVPTGMLVKPSKSTRLISISMPT